MSYRQVFLRQKAVRRCLGAFCVLMAGLLLTSSTIARAFWPGSTNGLVFLWEDGSKANEVPEVSGKRQRVCRAEPRGRAKFGRFWDMDLTDGAFATDRANENALLAACRASGQFTIEALVTPAKAVQRGPARIISFAPATGAGNFVLGQEGASLVLRLKTTQLPAAEWQINLCPLLPGKPQHILVTYRTGRLDCYKDGVPIPVAKAPTGALSVWTPQPLLFGGETRKDRASWAGFLEGIALSSRFTPASEVKTRFEAYTARLKDRKPARTLVVQGVLTKNTPVPSLAEIAPYRRALVVNEYAVKQVLQGVYKPASILVAEWAILDGKPLPDTGKIGTVYRLHLVNFSDYPPLESERLVSDSEEFDLEMYHALARQ